MQCFPPFQLLCVKAAFGFEFWSGIPVIHTLNCVLILSVTEPEPDFMHYSFQSDALQLFLGFSALFLFPLFSLCILHRFHSSFLFLILLYRSTEESGTGRSPTCFHGYRACSCEGAYAHVFPFSFITFLRMVLCFWDSGKIMDSMSVCGGFYSVYSHFSSLFAIWWNCDKLPIIKPRCVCVCV